MARLRPAMVAVIGTVLVLAGCGDAQPAGGPSDARPAHGDDLVRHCRGHAPASRAPTKQAPKPAPKPVPELLRFNAKTVDGKDFSGASLAGKPALLWFWAPWCSNCQAEAPTMAEAAKSLLEGAVRRRRRAGPGAGDAGLRRRVRPGHVPARRGHRGRHLEAVRRDLPAGLRVRQLERRHRGRDGPSSTGTSCSVAWTPCADGRRARSSPSVRGCSPRSTRAASPCCRATSRWSSATPGRQSFRAVGPGAGRGRADDGGVRRGVRRVRPAQCRRWRRRCSSGCRWSRWFSGSAWAVLGVLLLAGRQVGLLLPKPARGAPSTRIVSMAGYGVAFAVASLSCSIGPFLAAAGVALRVGRARHRARDVRRVRGGHGPGRRGPRGRGGARQHGGGHRPAARVAAT